MEENIFIHTNLRWLRQKRKLTIAQLLAATKLTISSNTYASYEDSRENIPKYGVQKAILQYYSDAFQVRIYIDDLFERDMENEGLPESKETFPNSELLKIIFNQAAALNNITSKI
ncbi:MAG: helix-turn-helix domain-containing protein [Saprospiraceae bacterium]|nr:helix-turn-helix domain-containing protein [Saprospiraceae bacterium]